MISLHLLAFTWRGEWGGQPGDECKRGASGRGDRARPCRGFAIKSVLKLLAGVALNLLIRPQRLRPLLGAAQHCRFKLKCKNQGVLYYSRLIDGFVCSIASLLPEGPFDLTDQHTCSCTRLVEPLKPIINWLQCWLEKS
ncbi:hypothetical protein RRG08_057018 [Elysia crispata]|uniref:Uncharacterized protein n=1 Tax=Elysia crispata TaxID=231223 RepID=A0AAE0Z6G4_9GAST|nr:hypothetical protein RRG08_057018 [Elysia crispata]